MLLGPVSPDPNGSNVVVETPAVRSLFGSSLDAAWAPAVLASFGSAADRVTVRVIAPHGVAVYDVLLKADQAARKTAGAALLKDPRISCSSPARAQLAGGLVDSRLLAALAALARHQPISIAGFGDPGPGASAGLPLRSADLAEDDQAAHLDRHRLREGSARQPGHDAHRVPADPGDNRDIATRAGLAAGPGHRAQPAQVTRNWRLGHLHSCSEPLPQPGRHRGDGQRVDELARRPGQPPAPHRPQAQPQVHAGAGLPADRAGRSVIDQVTFIRLRTDR